MITGPLPIAAFPLNTAQDGVEDMLETQQELADQYGAALQAALTNLQSFSFDSAGAGAELSDTGELPSVGSAPTPQRPDAYASQMQSATMEDIRALIDSLGLTPITRSVLDIPSFTGVRPDLTDYEDPVTTDVSIPQETPSLTLPELPTRPNLVIPDDSAFNSILAALDTIQIPGPAQYNKLTFEAVLADSTLRAPEPLFVYTEQTYQTDLQDALKLRLYNDVKYGGTGMSEATEQAILDAALDSLDIELEKSQNDTFSVWSARGYEFAPGELKAAIRQDTTANNRLRTKVVNEIAKIKYDAEQRWNEVALQGALTLEKQWMENLNQAANRAFEAAKYEVQYHIDVFNAHLALRDSERKDFLAYADGFEKRLRGELAELENTKLELESGNLAAEIQGKKAAILNQRWEGLKIMVALYAEEMNAAKIAGDLEKLKLEGFRELIGAKTAQIGANTAKYNLHQAKLAGNETRAKIYATDAEVYSKLVGAKKTEADIRLAELQADLEGNKQTIDVLRAAIEKYRADSEHFEKEEDSKIKAFIAETGLYEADTRLLSAYWGSLSETYRANVSRAIAQSEVAVKQAEIEARSALGQMEIAAENMRAAANVAAQAYASALSTVSASYSMGYNESKSNSYTQSDSNSFSLIHTYDINEAFD